MHNHQHVQLKEYFKTIEFVQMIINTHDNTFLECHGKVGNGPLIDNHIPVSTVPIYYRNKGPLGLISLERTM